MRAEGNADPMVCLQNLTSIYKTECPMSRDKGIDARLIDRPAASVEEIDESVTDLVADYEPRISVSDVVITANEEGDFSIDVRAGRSEDGAV